MRNIRVAIFLPDLRGGGAERVAVNLANNFSDRGFLVDMVLVSENGEFLDELNRNIKIVDLRVNRLRSVLMPLIRYLKQEEPQVLLVFMWPLTVLAIVSRWMSRTNTRVVVVEHTTWAASDLVRRRFGSLKIRGTMKLTFPFADTVAAVSHGAAESLAEFSSIDINKIKVLYNPVYVPHATHFELPKKPVEWWKTGQTSILAVGALKSIKDYGTLLYAFSKVRKVSVCSLLVLGEGECRPMLEALVRELKLESSVFLPGFVIDPKPYYLRADLHVLSSRGEGLSNVIIEALAVGTPVVSTDCPSGPREILCDGKYGRLVPVGDVGALSQAILEELEKEHDREALVERAKDFSVDKIAEEYLDVMLPGWRGK